MPKTRSVYGGAPRGNKQQGGLAGGGVLRNSNLASVVPAPEEAAGSGEPASASPAQRQAEKHGLTKDGKEVGELGSGGGRMLRALAALLVIGAAGAGVVFSGALEGGGSSGSDDDVAATGPTTAVVYVKSTDGSETLALSANAPHSSVLSTLVYHDSLSTTDQAAKQQLAPPTESGFRLATISEPQAKITAQLTLPKAAGLSTDDFIAGIMGTPPLLTALTGPIQTAACAPFAGTPQEAPCRAEVESIQAGTQPGAGRRLSEMSLRGNAAAEEDSEGSMSDYMFGYGWLFGSSARRRLAAAGLNVNVKLRIVGLDSTRVNTVQGTLGASTVQQELTAALGASVVAAVEREVVKASVSGSTTSVFAGVIVSELASLSIGATGHTTVTVRDFAGSFGAGLRGTPPNITR